MSRVFLIDTDTASDDAVALIMAIHAPEVRVAAITTVAGNVDLDQATRNALYTVELCGSDIPVYSGAGKPLLRAHQNARWFHGNDGLGNRGYPPPQRVPEERPAVEAITETVEANPGLVVVTLGPLTNLALALALKPSIVAAFAEHRCSLWILGAARNDTAKQPEHAEALKRVKAGDGGDCDGRSGNSRTPEVPSPCCRYQKVQPDEREYGLSEHTESDIHDHACGCGRYPRALQHRQTNSNQISPPSSAAAAKLLSESPIQRIQ